MDSKGLLFCARYSSAPNFFGYCGPPKNSTLIDHLRDEIGDKEIESILSQFDTLYLNLSLIAHENKIKDPFDQRVVEAYWLGNSLLNNIKRKNYTALLGEKFDLEKKIGRNNFDRLKYKFLSHQILPHHSFHVFNIFKRTGHNFSFHTLSTMNECRIGWGKIVKFPISNFSFDKLRIPSKVEGQFPNKSQKPKIIVETKQLAINNPSTTSTSLSINPLRTSQQLSLGKPTVKKLQLDYKGKIFLKNLKVGDWVSFHWGFVCDKLTQPQVNNLEYYTNEAIRFYNTSVET